RVLRDQCRRRHPHGAGNGSGPYCGDHALRLWQSLSKQIVQSGIPERKGFAGAALVKRKARHPDPLSKMSNIVSAEWLKNNLTKVRVVDGSWYMPDDKRDTKKEFEEIGHIPGAVFFDIDGIADHATALPHMLPDADHFARDV